MRSHLECYTHLCVLGFLVLLSAQQRSIVARGTKEGCHCIHSQCLPCVCVCVGSDGPFSKRSHIHWELPRPHISKQMIQPQSRPERIPWISINNSLTKVCCGFPEGQIAPKKLPRGQVHVSMDGILHFGTIFGGFLVPELKMYPPIWHLRRVGGETVHPNCHRKWPFA